MNHLTVRHTVQFALALLITLAVSVATPTAAQQQAALAQQQALVRAQQATALAQQQKGSLASITTAANTNTQSQQSAFTSSSEAGHPSVQCISVVRMPGASGDVWGFKNSCNFEVEVRFCVRNQRSSQSCPDHVGETGVGANGNEYALPFYQEEGGGVVTIAVCSNHAVPVAWDMQPDGHFSCQ